MLGEADVMATIAVEDLEAAKRFYEGTLGLEPTAVALDGLGRGGDVVPRARIARAAPASLPGYGQVAKASVSVTAGAGGPG